MEGESSGNKNMAKEAGREGRIHYDALEKECARRAAWMETCEMPGMRM